MLQEAVESFRKALILLSPNETNLCNCPEAAEVFYLTGLCFMAQDLLLQVALQYDSTLPDGLHANQFWVQFHLS